MGKVFGHRLGQHLDTDQRFFGVAGSHAGPQLNILKPHDSIHIPSKIVMGHKIELFNATDS
jgi:hypothetical protein